MSGIINLPHSCPKCNNKTANSYQELDELFGFRNMPKGARNQSWCRDCRNKK